MAEVDPLVYGGQVAKDFIPGAEALPEEAESAEGEKEENGERERERNLSIKWIETIWSVFNVKIYCRYTINAISYFKGYPILV